MARLGPLILCLMAITAQTYGRENARAKRDDRIKITTIEEEPYIKYDSSKSGNARFEGFIADLMKDLAKEENLKYDLHIVGDGRYGQEVGGGWNGMIGEVIGNEAEMAAAPMTISESRAAVVDFTEPFMEFDTTILMKKSSDGKAPAVNSLGGLADQSDIKYGLVKGGVTENFFKTSNSEPYKKMWAEMQKDPKNLMSTLKDGVDRVIKENGKFAFIMESSSAKYWTNQNCDLITVGEGEASTGKYALATEKGSPLKAKLNKGIRTLTDNGRIEELEAKWWKGDCPSSGSSPVHGISALYSVIVALLCFFLR